MKRALRESASESDAVFLQRFFKTGEGQYGFGDKFLGVRVPATRRVVKQFRSATLEHAIELLHSEWHEERLLALQLMVAQYRSGDEKLRRQIFKTYLEHTAFINNWDLVDTSAEHIVGAHLLVIADPARLLNKLAKSSQLWERRIAMLATFHLIRRGQFELAFSVAELLLADTHDLMHKAVGWMLREIGKRNLPAEILFLSKHYHAMPRTMLRYAIERFPEPLRQKYLKGIA